MKRTVCMLCVIAVIGAVFAACDMTDPIIGEWVEKNSPKNGYTFQDDGVCYVTRNGKNVQSFSYETKDGQIFVNGTAMYEYEFKDGNLILYSIINGKVYRDKGGVYIRKQG